MRRNEKGLILCLLICLFCFDFESGFVQGRHKVHVINAPEERNLVSIEDISTAKEISVESGEMEENDVPEERALGEFGVHVINAPKERHLEGFGVHEIDAPKERKLGEGFGVHKIDAPKERKLGEFGVHEIDAPKERKLGGFGVHEIDAPKERKLGGFGVHKIDAPKERKLGEFGVHEIDAPKERKLGGFGVHEIDAPKERKLGGFGMHEIDAPKERHLGGTMGVHMINAPKERHLKEGGGGFGVQVVSAPKERPGERHEAIRDGKKGARFHITQNRVIKGGVGGKAGGKLHSSVVRTGSSSGTFNVKNYNARGDGRNDDTQAFMQAWKEACAASGTVNFVVPKGTYLVGPLRFTGPCKSVKHINFQLQGFLKATTDLHRFSKGSDWVEFGWVEGLTLGGGGTLDGQGSSSWPFNKCPTNKNCNTLPNNVKFVQMTNTVINSLTSLNSKFFHIVLLDCTNFKASGLKISAPGNSPNTDGIHIERSSDVQISNAIIGTGDDCISIGQGNSRVHIKSITCGPGHGISVGSLGRYDNEGDVNGLIVEDCTMFGTMNGIRIKTWANSPDASAATNMTFENIVMNNVGNPIIIDQTYCPYTYCTSMAPSRVKLSDIFFRNIRGTTSTPVAVMLECSKGAPCQNVNLEDVHLDLSSGGTSAKATCVNVKAKYHGTQIPPPCE